MDVLEVIWHGLKDSFLMAWEVWWALVIGFAISGIVQAWVPRERPAARRWATGPSPRARVSPRNSLVTAFARSTFIPHIGSSSSCSYAAIAIAKSLFQKGASALHTADRYRQIAGFLQGARQPWASKGRHRIARLLHARRHGPGGHTAANHNHGDHDGAYSAEAVDLDGLLDRLSDARDALGVIGELTDAQLDAVPPADSFRFCDGQRTLEQVVVGLLKHQGHQLDAIRAASAP